METVKYFDHRSHRPIDVESDGCELAQWDRLYGHARFARHPKGFKVFLAPDKLIASDEYADSDPYSVEQGLDEPFHLRRIDHTIELAQEVVSSVQGTPRILDLGCGQGHITNELRKKLKTAELAGLDYSVSAIEYAHEHFKDIDFVVGDAYEPPYPKGYFDLVICNNLWEHMPDPLNLLSKIRYVLKSGGFVLISTPSRNRIRNLVRVLMGKPITLMSPLHVTEYTVGQVVEHFRFGGFEVKKVLSRPISMGSLKLELARRLFAAWIWLVGSHHQLESTVFYLAKESSPVVEPGDG